VAQLLPVKDDDSTEALNAENNFLLFDESHLGQVTSSEFVDVL
jgi:hypothetical protein